MSQTAEKLGALTAVVESRADGCTIVRCAAALPQPARALNARLHHFAATTPDAIFLGQRGADGQWRRLTYADTQRKVRHMASALLARKLNAEHPVLILSGNSIEHALLALSCMEIGVPYCPISTAYALVSQDFGKLRHAVELLTPGLVFAAEGQAYAKALLQAIPAGTEIVVADGTEAQFGGTAFSALLDTPADAAVAAAHAATGPDTIAKFLLTSGSTGEPKAVTNSQAMLCANQEMLREAMPFLKAEPPVLVDWLPWSHTFGGNHNFNMALYNGGALYIDNGKPMPGGIDATVQNLTEIAPTVYFNVPRGYEALLPHLASNAAFRDMFLSRLHLIFYAGAGLSKTVWDELHAITARAKGKPILMTTSLGSTETAPAALFGMREVGAPGNVGIPLPGVELKLVPNGGKLEARLRGANITPGYWRKPDLSAAAFDEEGFYKIGDALKPAVANDLTQGFVFDGRIAEDFKLGSGTWVSVGPLRLALVNALSPFVKDAAITGHDRADIGALLFPDFEALRSVAQNPAAPAAGLAADAGVAQVLRHKLQQFASHATGSSTRVARLMVLVSPPSIDLGEITDKGSLNQRAVLGNRAQDVAALHAAQPGACVIALGKG